MLPDWLLWLARLGAPCAAILMPLGFFLSIAPPQAKQTTEAIWLVYIGAIILAAGVLALAAGLIRAGIRA